ncbi:MAG: hypothetical protein H6R45_1173 [Proteobacteria bacterium]|nr:hypothetical protein [Pseudomonadota bacterium]
MTDTNLVDMKPFLERHERRARHIFIAMLSVSLTLSAVVFTRAVLKGGAPGEVLLTLWMPVVQGPLTIGVLWIASALYGRKRPLPFDGSLPMNPDDARNAARVANAGLVFVTGFGVVAIAGQVFWLLWKAGLLPDAGDWGFRATLAAIGALSAYFGNVSTRMPTPRAPEAKPGVRMKYNRLAGWMCVLLGLGFAFAGLFLPLSALPAAVGILSITVLAAFAVGTVMYYSALKSPSTR